MCEHVTHTGTNQIVEITFEGPWMLNLPEKDVKVISIDLFKELKEMRLKGWKQSVTQYLVNRQDHIHKGQVESQV